MRYISQIYNFSLTPVVRSIIMVNACVWFVLVIILQGLFSDKNIVFHFLGLVPSKIISHFWFWQIFTYLFVHATGFFHIFFNMFALWMFGTELERLWGSRFFLIYYFVCGVGAGLIYLISLLLGISFFETNPNSIFIPMVGASGAIFGILFAYGLIFSERIIFFMMIFPIKARYFTILIGLIEFASLVNSGTGGPISHLAHLSGFISGFLFLQIWKLIQNFKIYQQRKRPTHLKVLRNNKYEDSSLH